MLLSVINFTYSYLNVCLDYYAVMEWYGLGSTHILVGMPNRKIVILLVITQPFGNNFIEDLLGYDFQFLGYQVSHFASTFNFYRIEEVNLFLFSELFNLSVLTVHDNTESHHM